MGATQDIAQRLATLRAALKSQGTPDPNTLAAHIDALASIVQDLNTAALESS